MVNVKQTPLDRYRKSGYQKTGLAKAHSNWAGSTTHPQRGVAEREGRRGSEQNGHRNRSTEERQAELG